jgi:hypothetical protein
MFNIFFQNFFVTWGENKLKVENFNISEKKKLVWKTAKVVVGYILLKANIPIIYLSCKTFIWWVEVDTMDFDT